MRDLSDRIVQWWGLPVFTQEGPHPQPGIQGSILAGRFYTIVSVEGKEFYLWKESESVFEGKR